MLREGCEAQERIGGRRRRRLPRPSLGQWLLGQHGPARRRRSPADCSRCRSCSRRRAPGMFVGHAEGIAGLRWTRAGRRRDAACPRFRAAHGADCGDPLARWSPRSAGASGSSPVPGCCWPSAASAARPDAARLLAARRRAAGRRLRPDAVRPLDRGAPGGPAAARALLGEAATRPHTPKATACPWTRPSP